MCSMVWGIRCTRDPVKGQTWQEMVRKKREKKCQETGERSQGFQAKLTQESSGEYFFEVTEYVNNFQWGTFSCYGYCQSRLN